MSAGTVGFIGLGRMGTPMSARLLEAGHAVTVFDTSAAAVQAAVARGATAATSAQDVASKAEIVFVSLPTPEIVQRVALGPEGVAQGGAVRIFIDLSTSGPRTATAVSQGLAAAGPIASIDCPVSGGILGATKGTLALMASGPRPAFDRIEPLLKVFGKVTFCGERPGLGQSLKLANNLLAAAALAVTSEAFAMGVKAGLDPQVMVDVINASSGRNSATQDKFPRSVLPRTFDFGFATGLSYKDVRLCVEEAEAMGIPMIVGSAVRQMLAVTSAQFGPDSDFTSIAKVLEQWAGVEIKGS